MRSAEVEFMGGEAHGTQWSLQADDDGVPPSTVEFVVPLTDGTTTERYVRTVNTLNTGPTWIYILDVPKQAPV